MLEIKLRIIQSEKVVNSEKPTLDLTSFDIEFCYLQIRKIIELIVLSSLVRNQDRYKRLRELQKEKNTKDHGDYSKDWESPEMLKRLYEISPHFLPIPIRDIATKTDGSFHINKKIFP